MEQREVTFIKQVPPAGPWAGSLTCFDLFRPRSQLLEGPQFLPFYRWENGGFEKLSDRFTVTVKSGIAVCPLLPLFNPH